jgi:hypothetical protein
MELGVQVRGGATATSKAAKAISHKHFESKTGAHFPAIGLRPTFSLLRFVILNWGWFRII